MAEDPIDKKQPERKISEIESLFKSRLDSFKEMLLSKFQEENIISRETEEKKIINKRKAPKINIVDKADIPIDNIKPLNENKAVDISDENSIELKNLQEFRGLVEIVASILKMEPTDFFEIISELDRKKVFNYSSAPLWEIIRTELERPSRIQNTDTGNKAINKLKSYNVRVLPYLTSLLEYLSLEKAKEHLNSYEFKTQVKANRNRIDFVGLSYANSFPDVLFEVTFRRKNADVIKDILLQSVEELRGYNNVTRKENILVQILFTSEDTNNFDKTVFEFKKTIEEEYPEYIDRIIYLPISIHSNGLHSVDREMSRLQEIFSQIKNDMNVIFKERPCIISNGDDLKISSDFITKPIGSFAVWVQVPPVAKLVEEISNNLYIVSHDTMGGEMGHKSYLNAWSFGLNPKVYSKLPENEIKWRIWMTNDREEDFELVSEELKNVDVEWYHILIRWNHNKPLLELLINGKPVNNSREYFNNWPKNFSKTLRIGNWTLRNPRWHLNMPLYRIISSNNYLSDLWLKNEMENHSPKSFTTQPGQFYYKPDIKIDEALGTIIPIKEYYDEYLIKEANFGYANQWADVTLRLRKMIRDGILGFNIDANRFGDPYTGIVKELHIKCNIRGVEKSITANEHTYFNFKEQ